MDIYEYSKVSDTDGSVLDLNENLKIELKNDDVQTFNTRWNDTVLAMSKPPDEEILESFFFYRHNSQNSEH